MLGRVRTTDGQRLVRQGHDISVQAGGGCEQLQQAM